MKVLLTSDWHKAPFKDVKFKTQKPNLIEKIIIWLTSSKKKMTCVFERMAEVIRNEKIGIVINNGDMMENPQNERGLVTREGIDVAKKIRRKFCWQNNVHMKHNAGNHELGYKLPLSTDRDGGMSFASIAGFQELAGISGEPLCQLFCHMSYTFIMIPFGLAQESAKDFNVDKFKSYVLEDLWKHCRNLGSERRIILFLHDPEALSYEPLYRMIRNFKYKISGIFCGHWHAEWAYWPNWLLINIFNKWWLQSIGMITWSLIALLSKSFRIPQEVKRDFRKFKDVPARMRELGVTIIPAPLGKLELGGGFFTLDLGNMEITKY